MSNAAVVLASGGLDSTVVAAIATSECKSLTLVTFDYGQRHRREVEAAAAVANYYAAEQVVVKLNSGAWGGSALTDPSIELPMAREINSSIPPTYVPARNLIFLSVALGIAEARDADFVYIGVNTLDYSGYPDCRQAFIEAFEDAARLGLKRGVEGNPILIKTPLINMNKADIVREGIRIEAPLRLTWSCYAGGIAPCGTCDACVLRARGFSEAGVPDPALTGD